MVEDQSADQQLDAAEAATIAQAQAGDKRAWTTLMQRYQTPAFRLAYLLLRDAAAAEDVTQEAFIRAYLKLDQFDAKRPFRPWLLQITRHLVYNRQRSVRRYLEMTRRFFQQTTLVEKPSQAERLAHQTRSDALWQAVQQLKPAAQEVIYLRYFLEMSEQETAVTLNIPTGTVKSRTYRAVRDLRGIVERQFPELREQL